MPLVPRHLKRIALVTVIEVAGATLAGLIAIGACWYMANRFFDRYVPQQAPATRPAGK